MTEIQIPGSDLEESVRLDFGDLEKFHEREDRRFFWNHFISNCASTEEAIVCSGQTRMFTENLGNKISVINSRSTPYMNSGYV